MEKIYCPVNGWDCPYWQKGGFCSMENPIEECDDFFVFWAEGEDFYCEDDEE